MIIFLLNRVKLNMTLMVTAAGAFYVDQGLVSF